MINDPYSEFKARISIQDLLIDAGYKLNRRDGLRYPSYVKTDNEGRRIHGDKFLVTPNGQCCFQPPVMKCFNIISFIKEHPEKFMDYTPGMNLDRLVFLVCNRLLHHPIENRDTRIINPAHHLPNFNIKEYNVQHLDPNDWETRKPFFPFFKPRGISGRTQDAFHDHFVLAERKAENGRTYRNLSFPMTIPGKEDKVVGFEERGLRRSDGSSYKGMAKGSNASEGLWHASPKNTKLEEAKHVYLFESAYDAMAYYQMKMSRESGLTHMEKEELEKSIFASTGGNPAIMQLKGIIRNAKQATFHIGFDMDDAGKQFADLFKTQAKQENIPDERVVREKPKDGFKDFNDMLLDTLENADEEKKIQHDVDYTTSIDENGNVGMEVETTDQEEKHHGFRR